MLNLSKLKSQDNQTEVQSDKSLNGEMEHKKDLLHLWQRIKSVKEKPAKILIKSKRSIIINLEQWFSSLGNCALHVPLGNICTHFWLSQLLWSDANTPLGPSSHPTHIQCYHHLLYPECGWDL